VGPIDEQRLLARFQQELRQPVRGGSFVPQVWGQAGTIKVVRRDPIQTASGKLLSFHTLALAQRREHNGPGA
jgi:hypothetical protein